MPERSTERGIDPSVEPLDVTPESAESEETALEALDPTTRAIVGGLDPFDEVRTAEQIVSFRKEGARIVIEIGRRLVQAREHYKAAGFRGDAEDEGFLAFLSRCGVGQRNAYNHIKIAERLAETGLLERSPLLRMDAGVTKLLAITELDPDEIRELDEGGSVEGIGDLDDVDRMRVGELRQAVRQHKDGEQKAVDRVHELEAKTAEEKSLREHYEKVAKEGPVAPVEPLMEFLRYKHMIIEWLKKVQDLPKSERQTLFHQVSQEHASLADDMEVLIREQNRPKMPFPHTDHLTEEDE